MTLPEEVRGAVERHFGAVRGCRPVTGGCINPSVHLECAAGELFLKFNADAPAGAFATEAEGLRALAEVRSGVRVPEVLALSDGEGLYQWLALEWLAPATPVADHWQRLGRGLAALHAPGGAGWGWERQGHIGTLPQDNRQAGSWAAFWAERRLEPQLRRARERQLQPGEGAEWERLFALLPAALAAAEEEGPSLLHGDLWSGNVLATAAGPAVVDPAAYRGHREVDLAMTELFGGFDAAFYAAYWEARPVLPGYEEVRRGIYQLYYLLVHVNLFGPGYRRQTTAVLRQVLASA